MLNHYDWITICAPILLAVVGAWISIRPPAKKYHIYVAIGLVILGGLAGASALYQIRQTRTADEIAKNAANNSEDALNAEISALRRQVATLSETSIPTLIGDVKGLAPSKSVPPNLRLSFVHPTEVAIVVENDRHAGLADRPKYFVQLVDLDNLSAFLRIPTFMGDYIRSGEFIGPNEFMGMAEVKAVVKPGDRIFGSVGVSCPTCVKSRTYWLYVKAGDGGWYEEQEGAPRAIASIDAAKKLAVNFDAYANILAPPAKRVPIQQNFEWPK